jgi:hypothetical protein
MKEIKKEGSDAFKRELGLPLPNTEEKEPTPSFAGE